MKVTLDSAHAPRPPRDERLLPVLNNLRLVAWQFAGGGGRLGHAGKATNPRPMTPIDLAESADQSTSTYRRTLPMIPDLAVFPIWSSRRTVPMAKGVSVPPAHLWWFVQPMDEVLLSDRVTHHFTRVDEVDREQETISFVDPWADDFFLQEGRNTIGVKAHDTQITRAEFERAVVGLETLDRIGLFDAYVQAWPQQARSAETACRIGHAILRIRGERLTPFAAERFAQARVLAIEAGQRDLELDAAAHLYLASFCGYVDAAERQQPQLAAAMAAHSPALAAGYEAGVLLAQLTPDEISRMAYCAAKAKQSQQALVWCSEVIRREPSFEDAYWLRASAHAQLGHDPEALADVVRFLELNDRSLRELTERDRVRHPMDSVEGAKVAVGLADRLRARPYVLDVGVGAAWRQRDPLLAISYLRELRRLSPDDAEVARRLSVACSAVGLPVDEV